MGTVQIEKIALSDVRWDGNIRSAVDESQIDGLAQSMSQVGQLMPIRVRRRGEQFEGIDGMRRCLAAQRLNWPSLDALVDRDDLKEADCLQRQLISNCQRSDLPVMDKARAVDRLMKESGWNASEAAGRLGFSLPTVSRLLSLLTLPEEIQKQVEAGKLAPSTACELVRINDPSRQAALLQSAANGTLTRDAVTAKAKRVGNRRAKPEGRRICAVLDRSRSITVVGIEPSLDGLIASLEDALARARKARGQGLSLDTFTKLLRDTAATKGGMQ